MAIQTDAKTVRLQKGFCDSSSYIHLVSVMQETLLLFIGECIFSQVLVLNSSTLPKQWLCHRML